jgi:hypothetical protein
MKYFPLKYNNVYIKTFNGLMVKNVELKRTNIIRNGGFDTSLYWTTNGTGLIADGVFTVNNAGDSLVQIQENMASPILNNTTYEITYTVTGSGNKYFNIESASGGTPYLGVGSHSVGTYTATFTTPMSGTLGISFYAISGGIWTLDNIFLTAL